MAPHLDDVLNTIRHDIAIPVGFNTAGTADEEPGWRAPIACRVTAVRFIAETAITGDATNYATLSLENKGTAGSGTDEVASFAFDTPTTDDVAALDEKALTLSVTPADLVLAAGDILSIKKAVTGSGMVIDGIVIVEAAPSE